MIIKGEKGFWNDELKNVLKLMVKSILTFKIEWNKCLLNCSSIFRKNILQVLKFLMFGEFQCYQAKTSTLTHQSNTIKYNQSSNISNQIN